MTCPWKAFICLLLILASAVLGASAQVLTADDLARAGIVRLSDLLELADDWVGSSTEGYHWTVAPLGTSWEASPDWRLFLDGHPLHLHALNQQSLNALPVTLEEICEVHLHATPVLVDGGLVHGGAIQIHRCAPTKGISLDGYVSAGNETGDPGPYKYTHYGGQNVDRTGPTLHGSLAAATTKGYVRIQGATDEHHATDPRIRPRILQLYQGEKDARILYRALGIDGSWLGHSISAGSSQVEDLTFLPMMGREVPLNRQSMYVGSSFSRDRFGYSFSGSSTSVTTRPNPEAVSVDFTQRQVQVRGYATRSLANLLEFEYGLRAILTDATFGSTRMRHTFGTLRIDATMTPTFVSPVQIQIMTALARDSGVLGFELFMQSRHARTGLELQLLLRKRSLGSRSNFSHWAASGFRSLNAEIRLDPTGVPQRESLYAADLTWTTGTKNILSARVGIRAYRDYVRPYYESSLDSTQTYLQAVTHIKATQGQVARTSLHIHVPASSTLMLKIHSSYAYPWSDLHSFRDAWHHRFLMGLRAEFQPNERFSLDLRLRYTGSAVWHEYENAANENPEFYAMRLPGTLHMHLTVQKRLWKNHLRVSATMRNVLDHPRLVHPAGARTRAVFLVAIRYAFRTRSADPSQF